MSSKSYTTLIVVYKPRYGPTSLDEDIDAIVGFDHGSAGFDLFARERDLRYELPKDKDRTQVKVDQIRTFLQKSKECVSFLIEVDGRGV